MAEPHVIVGLRRQKAKVLAAIAQLENLIDKHRANLLHLDAAISICTGEPVSKPPQPKRLFQRGVVGQLVFAALRRSERPVSTAEIAALVAPSGERDVQRATLKRVGKNLAKFRKRGLVVGERRGNMTWWRLPE